MRFSDDVAGRNLQPCGALRTARRIGCAATHETELARRLVTSPKVFQQATPIEDAVAFVDALLAPPGVQLAPLGPEWPKLRQLSLDKQLGGNDLPDAWLAGAVAHLGEHLVSFDRDFRRLLARNQFALLAPA